jgi:magnesium-transporting ATPase (P-type)
VLTGEELGRLSAEELRTHVDHIRVYARVAPEQKLKIVRALRDRGELVAMTGDGVNDAPALKQADIGVAMGIAGTDVAKEASAMILLDDNFATIVRAVREGRRIYDNIRRFVRYAVTTNSGEIWTMFLAPLCGLPTPLLPIQILWINLVTDGLPRLALTAEPEESNIMRRPPRPPKESIFARGLGAHVLWVGPLMAALVLGIQAWSLASASSHWQTLVSRQCVIALADNGVHGPLPVATRACSGDPLRARITLPSAIVFEYTSLRRRRLDIPPADGHHLRASPQSHLQNGALKPSGVGGNSGRRGSGVRGSGNREMDGTQMVIQPDYRWWV